MSTPYQFNPSYIAQQQSSLYQMLLPRADAGTTNVTAAASQSADITARIPGAAAVPDVANAPAPGHSLLKSAHRAAPQQDVMVTKARLNDLIRDVDPSLCLEPEVEEALLACVDDVVDRIVNGASLIARHRHASTVEVEDVQQFLNRNYGIWVPGFGTDELRLCRRNFATEAHRQRLALLRRAVKKY